MTIGIEVRFPLGTYHAISSTDFGTPEWPPSPVRLLGGLLAAAHEVSEIDTEAARAVIQQLAAAEPPAILAAAEPPKLRGAARWAPRNHALGELSKGISPRNVGRGQAAIHKGGTVVGPRPVSFWWSGVELAPESAEVLEALVSELSFLGTSRSPVVGRVAFGDPASGADRWDPVLRGDAAGDTRIRIPDTGLISAFDKRQAARCASGRKPIATGDHVPAIPIGHSIPYTLRRMGVASASDTPVDPHEWGDMLILEVDRAAGSGSELSPKAPAAYLLARAFRAALLGAYEDPGMPGEAPPILRGRGADPHVAIVPLPFVGDFTNRAARPDGMIVERSIAADGIIRGIAVVFPSDSRVDDLAEQRLRVETGLREFVVDGDRRWIDIPGAGRMFLRLPAPARATMATLTEAKYRGPARVWESVVPVVHSRHRTSKGPRGVYRQVAADCRDVGLPEPEKVEVFDYARRGGAANKLTLAGLAPDHEWRNLVRGNRSHVRVTFGQAISGPVLLGRARHFGTGLCLPIGPSQ